MCLCASEVVHQCILTLQGYKALLSSPWYLNLGAYADEAWATYYKVEPLDFIAPPEQTRLVIGGEVRLPFLLDTGRQPGLYRFPGGPARMLGCWVCIFCGT